MEARLEKTERQDSGLRGAGSAIGVATSGMAARLGALHPLAILLLGAGLGGLAMAGLSRFFGRRSRPGLARSGILSHGDVVSLNREDLAA